MCPQILRHVRPSFVWNHRGKVWKDFKTLQEVSTFTFLDGLQRWHSELVWLGQEEAGLSACCHNFAMLPSLGFYEYRNTRKVSVIIRFRELKNTSASMCSCSHNSSFVFSKFCSFFSKYDTDMMEKKRKIFFASAFYCICLSFKSDLVHSTIQFIEM